MMTVVQIPVLMWSAKGREWFSLIFFIGFYLFNSLLQFYILKLLFYGRLATHKISSTE